MNEQDSQPRGDHDRSPSAHVIPVVEEQPVVTRRAGEIEHVRVRTSLDEREVLLHETVQRERVEIRRVPVECEVTARPEIREEGGMTIIPVVEERLVVEKRLFVIEEIHVSRSMRTEDVTLPTTLRRTRVEVERTDLTDNKEELDGRAE